MNTAPAVPGKNINIVAVGKMGDRIFKPEHLKFLEDIVWGTYFDEVAAIFNGHFKTNYSMLQIANLAKRNGLKNGLPGGGRIPGKFKTGGRPTPEVISFIKDNVKKKNNSELAESIVEQFGLHYTAGHIKYIRLCYGIKSTSGRKYLPVGSQRTNNHGYTIIKISETGKFSEDWKFKHHFVWEQANGPIPEGYYLLFADQNRDNCELNNLLLVSRSELSQLNKHRLIFDNKECTKTGLMIVRHKAALNKAIKRKNKRKK